MEGLVLLDLNSHVIMTYKNEDVIQNEIMFILVCFLYCGVVESVRVKHFKTLTNFGIFAAAFVKFFLKYFKKYKGVIIWV